jgi:hypothetical protein
MVKVRAAFTTGRRIDIKVLQNLAKPVGVCSATLTSVAVVDALLAEGDDAALFCAAIVIYVRRESRYASDLVEALGPHVRDAALWRILRALRRILSTRSLAPATRAVLLNRLLTIARDPARLRRSEFGPNSVSGKIMSLLEHLNIAPEDVFTPEEVARRLPSGQRGKPRQWNGNIRLYYEGRDCRLKASSYTIFGDFIDDVYERLCAEGSQILAYTYGVDWVLEAKNVQLPQLSPQDTTTLLDLGLRDDERVRFVQLADEAKLASRRAIAKASESKLETDDRSTDETG